MFTKMLGRIQKCFSHTIRHLSSVQYVQGQSPKQGVREYFYFIDHQGQVNSFRIYYESSLNNLHSHNTCYTAFP